MDAPAAIPWDAAVTQAHMEDTRPMRFFTQMVVRKLSANARSSCSSLHCRSSAMLIRGRDAVRPTLPLVAQLMAGREKPSIRASAPAAVTALALRTISPFARPIIESPKPAPLALRSKIVWAKALFIVTAFRRNNRSSKGISTAYW